MEQQSQKGLIAFVFAAGVSAWLLWLRRRRRLPPGSPWSLPLLGESLTYVRDPLGFIEDGGFDKSLRLQSFVLFAKVKVLVEAAPTTLFGFCCPVPGKALTIWRHLQVELAVRTDGDFGSHRCQCKAPLFGKGYGMASTLSKVDWQDVLANGE